MRELLQNVGGHVRMGDIYDFPSNQFTGLNVFAKELPEKFVQKSNVITQARAYDFSNSTSLKLSLLNIEGETKLSILCDSILSVSGSAAFIRHSSCKNEETRCTFVVRTRTGEHHINVSNKAMREYFDEDIKDDYGTHVVVGLIWGKNATAELFIKTKDESDRLQVKNKLETYVGKNGKFLNVTGNLNYDNTEISSVSDIRFTTDVGINYQYPTNALEAMEIINDLPKKLNNDDNIQVMEFYLMPLSTLKDAIGQTHGSEFIIQRIENNIIKNVEITFEKSQQFSAEISSLEDVLFENKAFVDHEEIKKVDRFTYDFDMAFSHFQNCIAEKLKAVRSGDMKSEEIDQICHTFKQNSDVGFEKVEMSEMQKAKDKITRIKNISKKGIICVETAEQFSSSLVLEHRDIYVLFYSNEHSNNFDEVFWQFLKLKKKYYDAPFVVVDTNITSIKIDNHVLSSSPMIIKIKEGKMVCSNVLEEEANNLKQDADEDHKVKMSLIAFAFLACGCAVAIYKNKSS